MRIALKAFFIVVPLVLAAADAPNTPKPAPPDDPADVTTVRELCHGSIGLDRDGNVAAVRLSGADLKTCARYGPALVVLRHVRLLGTYDGADEVLEFAKPWTTLESADLDLVSDARLAGLEHMQTLKSLWTSGWFVTDAGIKSVGKLKNLEVLTIDSARITDACMKDIAGLPKLKELDLQGEIPITDRGLAELKGMKLESLGLVRTKITDRGIDEIKDMRTLRWLDVTETKVTSAAGAKLKGIPGLQVRGIPREEVHEVPDDPDDVDAIEDAIDPNMTMDKVTGNVHELDASSDFEVPRTWIKHLKGLHSLRYLVLPPFATDDGDLALLPALLSLERLNIDSGKFSDAGMKSIGALTSLRDLRLTRCPRVTSAGLKHLSQLRNLEGLTLEGTSLTDDGLRHLANLTNLQRLTLAGSNLTDDGLRHLSNLTNLEWLDIGGTKVTDAGLVHLSLLTRLRGIGLAPTDTTDAGLVHLRGLTKLKGFQRGKGMTPPACWNSRRTCPNWQSRTPSILGPEIYGQFKGVGSLCDQATIHVQQRLPTPLNPSSVPWLGGCHE